jgi:hypothetical protein
MNSHFFTCSSGLSSTLGMTMVEECEGLYFKEVLPTRVTRYQWRSNMYPKYKQHVDGEI